MSRTLVLYYNGDSQKLKFFASTPREEFLNGIREVLGVAKDAPLRFRDGDGDIVILSSAMPDDTTLHVSVESGFPPQSRLLAVDAPPPNIQTSASAAVEWRKWESCTGGHISSDGFSFEVPRDSADGWWVFSHNLPMTEVSYMVVEFPERPCCACIGLIPSHTASLPAMHLISDTSYPFLVSLMGTGLGPQGGGHSSTAGASHLAIGLLFDPIQKILVILDHNSKCHKKTAIRLDGVCPEAKFAIQAPKHTIKAKIVTDAVPTEEAFQILSDKSTRFVKKPT